MKLLHGLAVSLVSGGLVACSLSAVDHGAQVIIRIEDQSPGQGVRNEAVVSPQSSATPPPTTLSGFDCIGVNVSGPGIPDSSHNPEPNTPLVFDRLLNRISYCSYRGILAGPVSTNATVPQEIALVVPPGNTRLVQLVGLKERNGSTDCVKEFLQNQPASSPSGTPEADIYEVGRAVVDLFQDRVISIIPDWNGLNTADQIGRELKCSSGSSGPNVLSPGTITPLGSLITPRYDLGTYLDTRITPPQIFIVGGAAVTTSEVYDTSAGTTAALTGAVTTGVYRPAVVPDPTGAGRVVRLGGVFADMTNRQTYDGTTWVSPTAISGGVGVGYSSPVYSPAQNATYLFGLYGTPATVTAIAKYTHAGGIVSLPGANLSVARSKASTVLLGDGSILIAGGTTTGTSPVSNCDIFIPPSTVTPCANLPAAVYDGVLVKLPDGNAMLIGGAISPTTASTSVQIYSKTLNSWTMGPSLPEPRTDARGVTLPDGRPFVVGGKTAGSAALMSTLFYQSGAWIYGPSLSVARMGMALELVTSPVSVFIIGGRNSGGTLLSNIDKWTP